MAGATMRQKFFVRFLEELKKQKNASEIMGYMTFINSFSEEILRKSKILN